MTSSPTPGSYIKPDLSAATLDRQFGFIQRRIRAKRARAWAPWMFAAASVAALLVFTWTVWPSSTGTAVNSVVELETAASGQALTLSDGSRLELGPNARLELMEVNADSTRVLLTRGRVTCTVTPNPKRRFIVAVDDYEVRVTGTRFTVVRNVDAEKVSVRVTRGSVVVLMPDEKSVNLGPGEDWSSLDPKAPPSSAAPAPTAAATSEGVAESESPTASQGKSPRAPSAKELFDRAQRARAAGKNAEAASAFRELRRRYPNDSRAALAAFELGRIELDAKKDPASAAKTLDDALKATPKDAPYREEVEARRVEALGASGNARGCASARDQYLRRYPRGIHRARVRRACR